MLNNKLEPTWFRRILNCRVLFACIGSKYTFGCWRIIPMHRFIFHWGCLSWGRLVSANTSPEHGGYSNTHPGTRVWPQVSGEISAPFEGRNSKLRKHLNVLSHMPAKLWLRAIWHSVPESSLRVEFTQWKKCSVCLLSACSWEVLTWHLKLRSSIYTLENCHEILTISFQFLFPCFQILSSSKFLLCPTGPVLHPFYLICPTF